MMVTALKSLAFRGKAKFARGEPDISQTFTRVKNRVSKSFLGFSSSKDKIFDHLHHDQINSDWASQYDKDYDTKQECNNGDTTGLSDTSSSRSSSKPSDLPVTTTTASPSDLVTLLTPSSAPNHAEDHNDRHIDALSCTYNERALIENAVWETTHTDKIGNEPCSPVLSQKWLRDRPVSYPGSEITGSSSFPENRDTCNSIQDESADIKSYSSGIKTTKNTHSRPDDETLTLNHELVAALVTEGQQLVEEFQSPPNDDDDEIGMSSWLGANEELQSDQEQSAQCIPGLKVGNGEATEGLEMAVRLPADFDIYADNPELHRFEEIINALDLDAMEKIALIVRRQKQIEDGSSVIATECEACLPPMCGTYNLVYLLIFDDGVEWIVRIPGYGASPTAMQIEKMDIEYRTMKWVRAQTQVKIPEVYSWSTSTTAIGTAFGMISCIDGQPLWKCWRDPAFDEQKRLTAIAEVAAEMAKLYPLQFPKTGMLRFDEQHNVSHVDYEIEQTVDDENVWGGFNTTGPFYDTDSWLDHVVSKCSRGKKLLGYPPFSRAYPIDDVKIILQSTPDFMRQAPLSISFTDVDFQNVFCDPRTGHFQGFIDMDNIRVTPVIIGSASYPRFLLRDRCRCIYSDDKEHGLLYADGDFPRYRRHYAAYFKAALPSNVRYDSRWTELSHHSFALEEAAHSEEGLMCDWLEGLACTAYNIIYLEKCGGDLRMTDWMQHLDRLSKNPWLRRRFQTTIEKALWLPESFDPAARGQTKKSSTLTKTSGAIQHQLPKTQNACAGELNQTRVSESHVNHDTSSKTLPGVGVPAVMGKIQPESNAEAGVSCIPSPHHSLTCSVTSQQSQGCNPTPDTSINSSFKVQITRSKEKITAVIRRLRTKHMFQYVRSSKVRNSCSLACQALWEWYEY